MQRISSPGDQAQINIKKMVEKKGCQKEKRKRNGKNDREIKGIHGELKYEACNV